MPFKKGKSGNPDGRPRGIKNKATSELRDRIKILMESEMDNLEATLKDLPAKERIDAFLKLAEFILPKLQRSEVRNLTSLEELLDMSREERLQRISEIKRELEDEK